MQTSCYTVVREREQALPRNLLASAATFRGDVSGSQGLIYRMELQRKLEGHGGCVNTVSFNPSGDLLVSGSDDQNVFLWDWRRGVRRLRFEPGHNNNIFQARFLPGTHDKSLITCAADGQVRVSYLREGSKKPATKRLHRHMGRAHKLALQYASPYNPAYGDAGGGGPPCFYSSGEDGDVCFFDLRVTDSEPLGLMAATVTGSGRPYERHTRQIIDLNAVHVNPARPWQLVVGGADEVVVVYDNRNLTSLTPSYHARTSGDGPAAATATSRRRRVDARPLIELCPSNLRRASDLGTVRHRTAHVTCVLFAQNGDVLATYNDDDVYLFRPPGTQGSGGGRGRPGRNDDSDEDSGARHRRPVIRSHGKDGGSGGVKDAGDGMSDDEYDSFLRPSRRQRRGGTSGGGRAATAAADKAAAAAVPRGPSRRGGSCGGDAEECADHVIGRYSGHRNQQTVKGVNFLGEREEWVVSGSDCGHIYIWSRDTCRLHSWLRGDTHVVNCLEPHPSLPLHLATSGIDNDVKLWAPTAEEPWAPGPAAHGAMERNARDRRGEHFGLFGIGGRSVVLPRAMLQMLLLGDLTRDSDGDGSGITRLRDRLAAALQPRNSDDTDEDDDDNEDEEEDVDEEDEEGEDDEDNEGGGEHDDDGDDNPDDEQEEEEVGEDVDLGGNSSSADIDIDVSGDSEKDEGSCGD
ncbi:hypothetical protein Vretimale_10439 [Volvox reticuliferus]|uniref:Uncharacterized protein n=1 Tax=Volvox reticuliferus TaxID=1737510 RepID=A0A8J4GF56_9CHLO|nr:hypothetical protein Vretifemale_12394 [Volvox reticuliferus]GIM06021.1 hypothetical protein Vretimale_10439 [Volvox reticuliferus]